MIRIIDVLLSVLGLVILSPVFVILALWIILSSKGPVIFRQKRIGLNGKEFRLIKFRSMYMDADKRGLLLTVGGRDPRITPLGRLLRKYKFDELPQLLNVLLGHMSIVGPRPEVKRYVDMYTRPQARVLNVRPGITDLASILFSDESAVLERAAEPEQFYIQTLMPLKIRLNRVYIEQPSVKKYFTVVGWTFLKILNALPARLRYTQRLVNKWIDKRIEDHNAKSA